MVYDIIIVGAGPAGMTAAIYAGRKKMNVVVLEAELVGGWVAKSHLIQNYPGYLGIEGSKLASIMEEQVKSLGIEIKYDGVKGAEKLEDGNFKVSCRSGAEIEGKTIIMASGASAKKLGMKGEDDFLGKGLSYCYICDGPLFGGKDVAVVGGGDSAAKAALMLSDIAKKVYLVHRRDEFRAEALHVEEMKKKSNIEFVLSYTPEEVKGGKMVDTLVVKSKKDESLRELKVEGVFIEIGNTPAGVIAKELGVELNDRNYIKVNKEQETNVPGVLAAGDVTDFPLKQIVSAVGQGAQATMAAAGYILRSKK